MEEGRGKITVAEVGQRREQGDGGRRRKTLGRKGAEEAAAPPVSPVRSCMAGKASCLPLPPLPVRVRGGFQGVLGGYSTHGIEGKHFWKSGREGGEALSEVFETNE